MAVLAERAADVCGKRVEWMWDGWFPLGALSLLGGPPGTAKSMLSVWLAAKVTRGELAGAWFGKPRNVLIISSEDDLADTIKPRLMAAGGDVGRAYFIDPGTVGLELPRSLDDLREFVVKHSIHLIIMDPVTSRLSDGLSANNDKDVRRALEPFTGMLRDLRIVAIGIMHMRKATTVDSVSAMMGSLAFVGLGRSVAATFEDDDGSFLFSSAKMNLGKKPDSLRYEVVSAGVTEDGEDFIDTARVRWMGVTDRTVDDVLVEKAAKLSGRPPIKRVTALGSAADFLKGMLADGPRLQRDIAEAAKAGGHSATTLARAKTGLRVVSRKTTAGWTWEIRHPYDLDEEQDDFA